MSKSTYKRAILESRVYVYRNVTPADKAANPVLSPKNILDDNKAAVKANRKVEKKPFVKPKATLRK